MLCSINQTRNALGIGRTLTYALINRGHLDVVKIGARTLITQESIDRFIKEKTI